MTTCWACDAELNPEWKYCIRCGVPVEKEQAVATANRNGRAQGAKPITPLAIFVRIAVAIGIALIVVAIVIVVRQK